MGDPMLTFERIRDVTTSSVNGITSNLSTIITDIYKDDICQPQTNSKSTGQRCIHLKKLLKEIARSPDKEYEIQQQVLDTMAKINDYQ